MKITPYQSQYFRLQFSLETGNNFVLIHSFNGFRTWFGENNRDLKVRNDRTTIAWLIENWPDAEWLEGSEALMNEHLDKCQDEVNLLEAKKGVLTSDFQFERKPMDHQRQGFEIAKDTKEFGWLFDPGTGKTLVALANASHLFQQGQIDMMIVIAWPSDVHYNWIENEVPADVACPYEAYAWERGSKGKTKKSRELREQFIKAEIGNHLKIVGFNVECFSGKDAKEFIFACLEDHRVMLVIDESASIKNPDSNRTKFVIGELSQHKNIHYRRILDGDPMAEGPQELFSQFYFLNPDIFRCSNFRQFKNLYVIEEQIPGMKFKKIVGFRDPDKIRQAIEPYVMRARKSEVLDLPPLVYKKQMFELTKEERRVYDELASEGLAFFTEDAREELAASKGTDPDDINDDDIMTEHLAMVKNLRLQQIAAGWFPKKDSHRKLEDDVMPSRMQALIDWVKHESNGEQFIVFTRFVADMNLIAEALGLFVFRGNDIEDIKSRFQRGEKQGMVGNSVKMSIGHTLTSAKHVLFYSNHPSLRYRTQGEARAHRKGQENSVTAWDFIARNTTDNKVVNALRDKRKVSDIIMDDPSGFFLQHQN